MCVSTVMTETPPRSHDCLCAASPSLTGEQRLIGNERWRHRNMATTPTVNAHSSRRVLSALTLTVALLAIGAFTLSFDALRALAELAGVNAQIAWLWPLIVDGFIVIATGAAVMLRDSGWRVSWYPWATLVLFAAVSVAGNALHATSHADLDAVSVTVASLVSAVPAVALLLASHLLVVLLSNATPARAAQITERDRPAEQHPTPARAAGTGLRSVGAHDQSSQTTVRVTPPYPRSEQDDASDTDPDASIKVWIDQQEATGAKVIGETLAEWLGVSAATGRRRLRRIRTTEVASE